MAILLFSDNSIHSHCGRDPQHPEKRKRLVHRDVVQYTSQAYEYDALLQCTELQIVLTCWL